MKLSKAGQDALMVLKENIDLINGEKGIKKFILPTMELFSISLPDAIKLSLKKCINLQVNYQDDISYSKLVTIYQSIQVNYFLSYLSSVIKLFEMSMDETLSINILIERILDFVEYNQLSILSIDCDAAHVVSMNPAVKIRILFFLMNTAYQFLMDSKKNNYFESVVENDMAILSRVDISSVSRLQDIEDGDELFMSFLSDLQIREGAIIAAGEIPKQNELFDIFTVYKNACYFSKSPRKNNLSSQYYGLAMRTLSQLSHACGFMQNGSKHLSLTVKPINQETLVNDASLVRRSYYGLNLVYTEDMPSDGNGTSNFDNSYAMQSANYYLDKLIKIQCLLHISQLHVQVMKSPSHPHQRRRLEKLSALQEICEADDKGELSPETITKARQDKPYLFVSFYQSKTEMLFHQIEIDIRKGLYQKMSTERQSIGQYGYSLTDRTLVSKLINKYLNYTDQLSYNPSQNIDNLLDNAEQRKMLVGYQLWHHDKKHALEIVLIANEQQLLHPALLAVIEEKFPCVYARSFSWLRSSQTEYLLNSVKDNITESIWQDAAVKRLQYA